jgi:hypothetical protein
MKHLAPLFLILALATTGTPQAPVKPKPVTVPAVAAELAAEDLESVAPEERAFTRYVWVKNGSQASYQAVAFVLNTTSRSSVIVQPRAVGRGDAVLVRVNLKDFAPVLADLKEWLELWDELQFDPDFSLLVTKDLIPLLDLDLPKVKKKVVETTQKKRTVKQRVALGGNQFAVRDVEETYSEETVREVEVPVSELGKDVVRFDAEHVPHFPKLREATKSLAPIVSHQYLFARMLSTIKGKGAFRTIFGGLYYEFAGIRRAGQKGSDEDLLFESLGVGNIAAGVTAADIFDRIRGDGRVGIFRSLVTGKPRRVDYFRTLLGWCFVTHDVSDEDIDVGQHAIMNLVEFVDFAREVIFTRANGMLGYALFNGRGTLQEFVPQNVAVDHRIPEPYTNTLQGAVACIRCHGPDRDGWKPLVNDVKILLARDVGVFGDLVKKDARDRIRGWYGGEPEEALEPLRNSYAAAVLRATGTWKVSPDQTDVVVLASQRVASDWDSYFYRTVGPVEALRELGFDVPLDSAITDGDEARRKQREQAVEHLRILLPPVPVNGVIVPEDVRIAALKSGLEINRVDWSLVTAFAARRSQATLIGGVK